jgi:hypothetical protein
MYPSNAGTMPCVGILHLAYTPQPSRRYSFISQNIIISDNTIKPFVQLRDWIPNNIVRSPRGYLRRFYESRDNQIGYLVYNLGSNVIPDGEPDKLKAQP